MQLSNQTLKGKEIKGAKFKAILCISDQHHPYQHKDIVPFLRGLNSRHDFDLVVNLGDEVDNHAMSFHESEPELYSPGDELAKAIEALQPLYKLFPKCEVIDSNHGSLVFRRGKWAKLPASVFRTPGEIINAPKGWHWSADLTVNTELGPVYFHHGKSGTSGKMSRNMGMNTVQGHYHSKFQIDFWGSPVGLFWDMHAGCLVDDSSLAMAYNKTTLQRPVIGTSMVLNGRPVLVPMHLDRKGRWTGRF